MPRPLKMKPDVLTERQEQTDLTRRVLDKIVQYPELACLFAIPNGGWKNASVAVQHMAEGEKPGVPDLSLPYARGGYNGLFIEMKRTKGGTVAPKQKAWHAWLKSQNYCMEVCKGMADAWDLLMTYIKLPPTNGVPELTYEQRLEHAYALLPDWAQAARYEIAARLKELSPPSSTR